MDKLERVARAIAQNGFGRDWDDFLPVNANDTDQGDLMEYAQAAIAALEPVTVRTCAKCGHPENNHPYRHPFVALAERGE